MPLFALLVILLLLAAFVVVKLRRALRRRRLLKTRLTPEDWALATTEVPLLNALPAHLRAPLEGKINLFLDQVTFYGYEGIEVDDGMRLAIAAQASLLIVGTKDWYDTLRTVLIYPSAFRSMQKRHEGYAVRERRVTRLGESWTHGPVILSWEHSARGAYDPMDGNNVVLHEFAHQLDGLSGHVNGVPVLRRGQSFAGWEGAFLPAYERHVQEVEAGHTTFIDAYGATNHEEFFAVSIEVFFEQPQRLKKEEPEIYAQLSHLMNLDPAGW